MTYIDSAVITLLIAGIWQFREPKRAKTGNLTAAFALFLAFCLVLYRYGIDDAGTVVIALLAGSTAGYALARSVDMIQVPAMVAFQHGAGGVAALLVSLVELTRTTHSLTPVSEISGVLGLVIGSLTFSGSMIASAKLAGKMRQVPQILPRHDLVLAANVAALTGVGTATFFAPAGAAYLLYTVQILLGTCFGILLAIRIGGADMPVLISSLNATAGLAASLCGMVIESQLLIAFGATVAASGSILTYVMCKGMNRRLSGVLFPAYQAGPAASGKSSSWDPTSATPVAEAKPSESADKQAEAVAALKAAGSVIIVPGYGMALAKAQQVVANLAEELVALGKIVKYAIHPVAGRMPGHMNVLLAEAGVDYDMLVEMEEINPDFPTTDLVLVIGACDVVNPAAVQAEGTPISGMPILMAHQARRVVCCNFDSKPGYSGVANTLYEQDNTLLLEGDAQKTLHELLKALGVAPESQAEQNAPEAPDAMAAAVEALHLAGSVIVIPGYGMALAKAQFKLVELTALLARRGATVKFAIHPVAGRMPGHMNVLLAEADVEYEDLLEMDEVNPLFAETDVAMVIGACDVVNPAAMASAGTPISGMPILLAQDARRIIVCNYDESPGYSGVANPLYENSKTIKLFGDAGETTTNLINALTKL